MGLKKLYLFIGVGGGGWEEGGEDSRGVGGGKGREGGIKCLKAIADTRQPSSLSLHFAFVNL